MSMGKGLVMVTRWTRRLITRWRASPVTSRVGPGRSAHRRVHTSLSTSSAYACAGQMYQTQRALSSAQAALDQTGEEPSPDWAAWVDATELQIMTGRCWTVMRRPLRAVPELEVGLARYKDSHARDKALYMTWLVEAYLDTNEIEQATTVADRALTLAHDVGSTRPLQRLASLVERFRPHRHLTAVADLLARFERDSGGFSHRYPYVVPTRHRCRWRRRLAPR